MKQGGSAVFLIHLLQDVNILRPLIFMAARDFQFDTLLLVSTKFAARDSMGIWRTELELICAQSGARVAFFDDGWEARGHLTGQGLLFSASESRLEDHSLTHDVFRLAPHGYVKITLQHGFECIGFRHSADHVRAHGTTVSFGADIVCAWSGADHLPSMARSQRAKLVVTGPASVLQMPSGGIGRIAPAPGIVCENLHSVRFKGAAERKIEFIDTFADFARRMSRRKRKVRLRAHPGGQYFLRNSVPLPRNVQIENAPLYRLDLSGFCYGISAPSSVLFDMILAGIPTAVWRDRDGDMDAGSYAGLTIVSSAKEWEAFARAAEQEPTRFIDNQRQFLERTGIPLDPRDVYARFARLFEAARRIEVRPPGSVAERERILFIANDSGSKAQLSVEELLAPQIARGEFVTGLLTPSQLCPASHPLGADGRQSAPIEGKLNAFNPSVLFLCGSHGPCAQSTLEWARRRGVPIICHVDDDLLDGSPVTGGDNDELPDHEPLKEVENLLSSATVIHASTESLKSRLLGQFPQIPGIAGKIRSADGFSALDLLTSNVDERAATAVRAQTAVEWHQNVAHRREQLLDVIAHAHATVGLQSQRTKKEVPIC
jgi:hypothetical protein